MKKIGLLLTMGMLLTGTFSVKAQEHSELFEKVEARRVAFLSSKLDFSPEEAQVFWPVYNAYQDEMADLKKSDRSAQGDFMRGQLDADVLLDRMIQQQEEEFILKKKYAYKMKAVIGSRKTLMFFRLERQFKEEMLRELKRKRTRSREGG